MRLRDFTTKDLIETDSRVMYTASTVRPGAGYLRRVVSNAASTWLAMFCSPAWLGCKGKPGEVGMIPLTQATPREGGGS